MAFWIGEAQIGSRRTIVRFELPPPPPGIEPDQYQPSVQMDGSIPRIDGELRPDIAVTYVLGRSRGRYERPANVIDNTKGA